jgi:predicted transcriptional regulator
MLNAKTFQDLFTITTKQAVPMRETWKEIQYTKTNKRRNVTVWRNIGNLVTMQKAFQGGGYRYLYAVPSAALVEFVKENMIQVAYDAISFSLMIDGDLATVRAEYSQIIGSRIVAVIDAATIPDGG